MHYKRRLKSSTKLVSLEYIQNRPAWRQTVPSVKGKPVHVLQWIQPLPACQTDGDSNPCSLEHAACQ